VTNLRTLLRRHWQAGAALMAADMASSTARLSLRRIKTRAWRTGLRARFLLFQRHRLNTVVLETIAGRPILVLPEVLNPKMFLTGEFLAETLEGLAPADLRGFLKPRRSATSRSEPNLAVLDMGTGSGVGAVFAAPWASRVVAVDINPAAVRCATINALLHGVEAKVEVRHGDLFEPVADERFDVILFNPPYFHGQPGTPFEAALWSTDVLERFVAGLDDHLQSDGCLLLLLSSAGEEQSWLRALAQAGCQIDPLARRDAVSEILTIYRCRRMEP
jgi:release factor glutamine methyltransferase